MTSLRKYKWSLIILGGFSIYFCFSALLAPFWGGNDTWSDLLPVVHYQNSLLKEHRLPLYTEQWYGGRQQWKNPLWNFFYLPATLIWLTLPLDWATRLILLGHLLFSLYAGWKLAALFLKKEEERIFASIIFVSPSLPAYLAGHIEKILSWGWILLALYFLLNNKSSFRKRGLLSGVCFGIVPLTGSNYYAFYGFILFLPLLLALRNKTILGYFILGASIGLIHLPSVAYAIGVERANSVRMIEQYRLNFWSVLASLSFGFTLPIHWDTWGCVGIGVVVLFTKSLWNSFKQRKLSIVYDERTALLLSLIVLFFFASGWIYKTAHSFDTFRVPARAIAFIALVVTLFCLEVMRSDEDKNKLNINFYLGVSAIQIILLAWLIRPIGYRYSYQDGGVNELVELLKQDNAKSVWINHQLPTNMNMEVGLTKQGFNLPNVYYGDMGQTVPVYGNFCGYAFDHIITSEKAEKFIVLTPNNEWENFAIPIPSDNLKLVGKVRVNDLLYWIYRLRC